MPLWVVLQGGRLSDKNGKIGIVNFEVFCPCAVLLGGAHASDLLRRFSSITISDNASILDSFSHLSFGLLIRAAVI